MGIPDFIRKFPEADINWPGLRGWMIGGENNLAVIFECSTPAEIGEHKHGAQWGMVIEGNLELTIAGETRTYNRGDSYFIPKNAVHSAKLSAGFIAIDIFEEKDRYLAKSNS